MDLVRNFSILILVVLATHGFWGVCTVVYALLLPASLQSSRVELLNVAILVGWVFFVGLLGRTLFSGPRARRFLIATMVLVILLCVWFGWSLHISFEPAQLIKKGPE